MTQNPLHFRTTVTQSADDVRRLNADNRLYASRDRSAAEQLARAEDDELLLVAWALAGQRSGHEWCACGECGALRLMKPPTPSSPRERCMMTYDCDGTIQRIAKRERMTKTIRAQLDLSDVCSYCGRVMSKREAAEQGACNDCYGGAYDDAS